MTILPVQWDVLGNPTMYASTPVYTTVRGKKVWVSKGYESPSVAEICKWAFMNAVIRRKAFEVADKSRMSAIG